MRKRRPLLRSTTMKSFWIGRAAIGMVMSGSIFAAPTTLRVPNIQASPGGNVTVTIQIAAQGTENALSFSLAYDASKLTFTGATLGSGAPGASLVTNPTLPTQAASGRIGVVISLPVNQNLQAGSFELLKLTFTAGAAAGDVTLGFGNSPAPKSVSDTLGNDLQCEFIDGTVTIQGAQALVITLQPHNQTVEAGSTITFAVVASGAAPLSYQWKKNGMNIPEATRSTWTLSSVTASDAGEYRVIVSNTGGSVTSQPATLTVNVAGTPPTISDFPDQT